ncbi:apoptosis-resistant E3 ubiquitin protein ligase 1 [Folsomia candida]|uniref:apoptosis-resistant E3 ubiquitin protein ligase 1 n=1 Tax=Folsomia candida TaxID=158441 RepID=UPI000B908A1E|nr:apoptosis-resistant E3 ubiquitin protein ligase 1 [Folsomia candida]
MSDILVSGGIFLAIVVIPFVGYKLYKKFAGKCGSHVPNSLFFCCRTRNRNHENYGNFLRKRIVPRVELDFPANLRVGQTISLRVIFPLCRHRTLEIVQHVSQPEPSLQESVYLQEEYNLDRLSIDIVKVSGSVSTHHTSPRVPPIRELLPRPPSASEDTLLVKFLVQEAGFYQINILYEDAHVPGSPFPIPFNAAELDPEKTVALRESPIVLSISGDILSMYISPKDRYGNECNFGDVDPALFHFSLLQLDDGHHPVLVESIVFNFSREIKKILGAPFDEPYEETLEVRLDVEIFLPGVFLASISYNGILIGNGTFDLVTLSPDEHNNLRSLISNNPGARFHEAKLLSSGQDLQKKPRQVYIYVAAKVLTIKEFYLGILPFRLAVFRILPATKVKLLSYNVERRQNILEISDRTQPKIVLEIEPTTSRIVLAMFALFLKQRLGGSESFENKQKFFYEELKSSKDVLRTTTSVLSINRDSILNSTLSETKNFSTKDWCRNFKINFVSEEGSDDGGLRREWLNLLCKEMFDNSADGMFTAMGNSRLVHPNAARDRAKYTLKHYELAGKIVAKCLFETAMGGFYKQMVNARFSRSFLGQVIGFSPHYKYFEQDDPELFMTKVKYLLENDVAPMELTFTEDEYSQSNGKLLKSVELISNGRNIAVINENREEYLNLLAQYRLCTKVKREIEAFVKGLSEIVPDGLLTNFDENELEILMCGRSTFSIDDLKLHHILSGEGTMYDRILPWFWIALTNMTDDERGRVLQFTTGSSLLPHGGFKDLQPTFRITVYDSIGKLPLAHTCFSEICLSVHRNYEEFEKALKIAINEGSEGFAIM